MKRFIPIQLFKKKKKTLENELEEEKKEESNLSPWQKENVEYLKKKKNEVDSAEKKALPLEVESKADLFQREEKKEPTSKVQRYLKPSELKEEDWLSIVPKPENKEKENMPVKKPVNAKESFSEQLQKVRQKSLKEVDKNQLKEEEKMLAKEAEDLAALDQHLKEKVQKKPLLTKKVRWQTTNFLVVFTLAFFVLLYYASPLSNLNEVLISGNEQLSAQAVEKTAHFQPGERLWHQYFDRKQVAQKLEKTYPEIQSVSIHLRHLNDLEIDIKEYPVVAYMIVNKIKYAPILSNGVILKETTKKKPNRVLYAKFKEGKFFQAVIASYDQVPKEVRQLIEQVTSTPTKSNPELVTLYMKDGNQVKVNGTEMAEKLPYYPQIAKQMKTKGIIDMEVGFYSYPYGNGKGEAVASGVPNISSGSINQSDSSSMEIVIPEN